MIKKAFKNVLWAIIPITLGIFFTSLIWNGVANIKNVEGSEKEGSSFIEKIRQIKIMNPRTKDGSFASVFKFGDITYPPQAKYFIKDDSRELDIGAVAYVVGDVDTGEIILEKNGESVFPIASVTKLMTALVSLETLDQNETTKVSSKAVATLSSRGELRSGENVLISDLLYPLLLVSSNDASEVLAEVPGREKFMEDMNSFAKQIGMEKTSFRDPSGLSAENKSTAKDLFKLSSYLQNNHRVVFDISALKKYTAIGKVWNNISTFSRNDNYIGGKTGYTDKARRTGVGLFSVSFENYDNRNIGIVLLRTDDRTTDTYSILNYIRENIAYGYEEELRESLQDEIAYGEILGEETVGNIIETKKVSSINKCPVPSGEFPDYKLFNANIENNLPEFYVPENLISIREKVNTKGRSLCLEEESAGALEEMYKAMKKEGLDMVVTSAFRNFDTQKFLFDKWNETNEAVEGQEAVAKPGHSEHQLGTTIDITSGAVGYASAHSRFYLTREYDWLDKNAHKYGFVLSYPPYKKTGYKFEPWHWRYVGVENAYTIKLRDVTVQEFLGDDEDTEIVRN